MTARPGTPRSSAEALTISARVQDKPPLLDPDTAEAIALVGDDARRRGQRVLAVLVDLYDRAPADRLAGLAGRYHRLQLIRRLASLEGSGELAAAKALARRLMWLRREAA